MAINMAGLANAVKDRMRGLWPRKGGAQASRSHQQRRNRIAMWAVVFGIVAALIELPMPLEDAARAGRAELRSQPAPDDIIVIAVDDATLNELGTGEPSRFEDARLVDVAFAGGVERLVFDRAYADPGTAKEDAALAESLAKHRGRVWLGASPEADNGLQQHAGLLPTESLRDSVAIASMMGQSAPFGLSARFPTSTVIDGKEVPSISAVLARYEGDNGWYRPDFAFDPSSVPTYSYADVLRGRVASAELGGKIAIVAPTHLQSKDFHNLPLGGKIPGVYFHVMGAHTLKGGLPIDLSWYPALMFVAVVLALQARRRRPVKSATWAAAGSLAAAPLLLETAGIGMDVFPALIALSVGTIRMNRLSGRLYSKSTSQLLPEAIADHRTDEDVDVYALRINNIGDFATPAVSKELGAFVDRLVTYLTVTTEANAREGTIAFEKDTLVWTAGRISRRELEENGLGLLSMLKAANGLSGGNQKVEATLGIDTNHALRLDERLQNATQAAEIASRRGGRVIVADAGYLGERSRRLALLSHLDRAILQNEIGIGFQPKVDLGTRRVVGAEALIRWTDEELGYVDPQELVRTAEDHGRIDDLTTYVIDKALEQGKAALARDPEFKLAVNLSAQTLCNEMILYHVARLLHRHAFPGKNLVIELTESSPLQDANVGNIIEGLRRQGAQFSIDDFGTGHSSLDYLKRVPSAEIKIDRRFVRELGSSDDSSAVVRGTIEMAHGMGKIVVAEGVEDDLTAERLRQMGCDQAQGFLYSPAVPIDAVIAMLEQERAAA